MTSKRYWAERIQDQQEKMFQKSLAEQRRQLAQYYRTAINSTMSEMSALYDRILADGGPEGTLVNNLYRMDRYHKMMSALTARLTALGQREITVDSAAMKGLYEKTARFVFEDVCQRPGLFVSFIVDQGAEKVLESVWAPDRKLWSSRIWDNMTALRASLEKGLVDCVSRGVSKGELVKTLKREFAVEFYKADRIARTELTYIQNQSAGDSYRTAGVESYEYLSAHDDRTSKPCKGLDGQIFLLKDAKVGVNYPPMHPNCRCTVVPVL
jgi:SPP1 gp7 family putative phage head morphogenesis protein